MTGGPIGGGIDTSDGTMLGATVQSAPSTCPVGTAVGQVWGGTDQSRVPSDGVSP